MKGTQNHDSAVRPEGAVISPSEFRLLRDFLYTHAGVYISDCKHTLVEARLNKRIRVLKLRSFRQYYDILTGNDADGRELSEFVNALTTNKTDFFREPEHFDLLQKEMLPARIAARQNANEKMLRFWSAACSSGEEPYTIAMCLDGERQRALQGWDIRILATDIDSGTLGKATRGRYSAEKMAGVPPALRQQYFRRNPSDGLWEVSGELRNLIRFRRFNLSNTLYPFNRSFDVVFLRNVMIYFDSRVREHVVNEITKHLAPGGYLVLGHAESLLGISHSLVQERPTIYRKGP